MRFVWRIVYPVLFICTSFLLAVFFPVLMIFFCAGMLVLLMLARQTNLYKMVMVLKRHAQKLGAKLRCDIRARMHMGFRDYNSSVSANADEELHHRTHGYMR